MRRPIAAVLATLALAAPVPAFAAGVLDDPGFCPVEQAVYELRDEAMGDAFGVSFVRARSFATIASDLYLRLTTPVRAYWFVFSVSQGYSGITLLPVTDPYRGEGPRDLLGPPFGDNPEGPEGNDIASLLRFLPLDADLGIDVEPPMSGEEAPPYLLMPEIGLALWYFPQALSGDPRAERDPMPRGVFKRTGCMVVPLPPALP